MVESLVFPLPEQPRYELAVPPPAKRDPLLDDSIRTLNQSLAEARAKNEVLKRATAEGSSVLNQLKLLETVKRERIALEKQVEARDKLLEKFSVFCSQLD